MSRHPLPHQASRISVYEVNTRQYTNEGTFEAFGRHLPRLADMGVDILWFMPVTPISVKGRKGSLGSYYAASDHRSVNPEFGRLGDLQAVVAEAHRLGMRVIIDWVANHTGCDHHWTLTRPDFYKRNDRPYAMVDRSMRHRRISLRHGHAHTGRFLGGGPGCP